MKRVTAKDKMEALDVEAKWSSSAQRAGVVRGVVVCTALTLLLVASAALVYTVSALDAILGG